jgi:putative dimethyl sulfoxide reductase chaperone
MDFASADLCTALEGMGEGISMSIIPAKLRQRGYDLMARAFSRPEAETYLETILHHLTRWCRALATRSTSLGLPFEPQSILQELTNILDQFEEKDRKYSLLALEIAYNRLFYGPGRPLVPPYASAYIHPRGQLVMGQPAIDILKLYRKEGLEIANTFHDLPDHLILELEFMSFLCEQEDSTDLPEKQWEKQYQFLIHHLIWWLPSFVDSLQECTTEPVYPSLARPLLQWVKSDLEYLEALVKKGVVPEKNSFSDYREKNQEKKNLSKHRHGYPCSQIDHEKQILLHIEGDCSFCGICSLHCQNGALELSLWENGVALNFYPARCSGCSICIETCPVQVLRLSRGLSPRNNQEASVEILAKSLYMQCEDCGNPIPLPGQAYVLHLLEQEGERDLLLFLRLCEPCRGRRLTHSQQEKNRFIYKEENPLVSYF